MKVSVEDCLAAIEQHTRGLAAAAAGNLDGRIEHCPDWSVGDLVWHLAEVHTFWTWVATTLPTVDPEEIPTAERPEDEDLVAALLAAMATLVDTLRAADQAAPCWTWGLEENVWFITRHQVQEAAVHHWDALNAAGRAADWSMEDRLAIDAVEEFLTHSVANARWPVPDAEPLGGTLAFGFTTEGGPTFYLTDGSVPGTTRVTTDPPSGTVESSTWKPAALLLWLYGRQDAEESAALQRLRRLSNSD